MKSNLKPINLAQKLVLFSDSRDPRKVGQFNGHDLMQVSVEGAFAGHGDPAVEEFYYVVRGRIEIDLGDRVVTLRAGDMHIVSAGVAHRPVARERAEILLIATPQRPDARDTVASAPHDWV